MATFEDFLQAPSAAAGEKVTFDSFVTPEQKAPAEDKAAFGLYPGTGKRSIDLTRPKLQNADGSFSTEQTIGIEADGKYYNIPTIVKGKRVSEDEAIRLWQAGANKEVGIFNSQKAADTAAAARSKRIGELRATEAVPPLTPPRTMADFLGKTAANVVSGADLVASMPAWLLGMPVDAGARLMGMAMSPWSGETRREVAQGGLNAKAKVMEALGEPLHKIAKMAGGEQAYEGSQVSQGMQSFGEYAERAGGMVEAATGGRVLKEDYLSMLDPAMAGLPGGIGRLRARAPVPPGAPSPEVQFSSRARPEPYVAPEEGRLSPQQGPQRPLAELLRKEAALDERLAKQGPDAEPGVATTYEPKAKPAPSTTSSDVLRAMRKPAFERTAEDLLAIRDARDKALVVGGLGAVATLMDEEEAAQGGMGLAMAAAAVKGRGGNWLDSTLGRVNPFRGAPKEAVSEALAQRAYGVPAAAANADPVAVKLADAGDRYFKTHFGSEADPLKDVRLPSGRTWSEAASAVVKHSPAEDLRMQEMTKENPWLAKVPPDERVYFIDASATPAQNINAMFNPDTSPARAAAEIKSYMHHVADFLRQNVPKEKLAQYDLPRAVRETVADDARMAREMERASAASTAELPVYKAYPDGTKWVELKLPEELTEAQGRGVRKLTDGKSAYVALDPEGKPIRNNYTKEEARGRTPKEAFLAGQLAREGNAMGHCVGGYCDPVASGETRIFSLRDAKGQPHVTVEVEPSRPIETRNFRELWIKEDSELSWPDWAKDRGHMRPAAITQIKGKQNRAPVAEYLPYVQDFVQKAPDGSPAKWADVGDLEGTGLQRQGGEYLTAEQLAARQPPRGQRGSVDPELLGAAGLAGAGAALLAYLDPSEKGSAALLEAGVGLAAFRIKPGRVAAGLDRFAGLTSTRVLNMSPALHRRWINFEHGLMSRAADMRSAVDPFLTRANRRGLASNSELSRAILTNDEGRVNAAIAAAKDPALEVAWRAVRKTLDETGRALKASGRVTKLLTDYFPRIVKDREGLLAALASKGQEGVQAKAQLEKLLAQAEGRALKTRGTGLTELEQSKIINDYLLAPLRRGSQPSWAKKRSIPEITAELEPFYLNITDGLHSYLRSAAMELEKAKFFGKDAQQVRVGDQQHINVDASIGNVVQRLLDSGEISHPQAVELSSMLKDRFGPGERASRGFVQDTRNMANALLLGNPLSAVVQFGDVAIAAAVHGIVPTLRAVGLILTGRGSIRPRDIGLVNHISEEFVSTRGTAKFLQGMLKWSGFSLVDSFGKAVNLEAARLKYEKLAQSPKGQAKIAEKYGRAYGEELPLLLKDLAARQLTPRTRSFYFSELSRTQPISKFETSQAYMANADPGFGPMDTRSLFQLKSFMLKQADLVRREAYNDIKTPGKRAGGYAKLAKIGILLGISGAGPDMVKDFLMGKEFDARWSDIPLNMLKTFGWSQYTLDKARSGKWGEVVGSTVIPPFRIFEQIVNRDPKAIQYLPLVGKVFYQQEWDAEGKARGQKKRRQEEMREVERSMRPFFGEPTEARKAAIRERKKLIRELRGQ